MTEISLQAGVPTLIEISKRSIVKPYSSLIKIRIGETPLETEFVLDDDGNEVASNFYAKADYATTLTVAEAAPDIEVMSVDEINALIAVKDDQINAITQDVSEVEENINTILQANTQMQSELTTEIESVSSELQAARIRIDNIQSTLNTVANTLELQQSELDTIEPRITDAVTRVNTLESRVEQAENSVTDALTRISALENKTESKILAVETSTALITVSRNNQRTLVATQAVAADSDKNLVIDFETYFRRSNDTASRTGALVNFEANVNGTWINLGNEGDVSIPHRRSGGREGKYSRRIVIDPESDLGVTGSYNISVVVSATAYNRDIEFNRMQNQNKAGKTMFANAQVEGFMLNKTGTTVTVSQEGK